MMSLRPEDLVEPIEFGVGEITPERLGMNTTHSPFYQPSDEPAPINPVSEGSESEVTTDFKHESLSEEVVSRTTATFETVVRFLMNNSKIVGMFILVGVGSYMVGKRRADRQD